MKRIGLTQRVQVIQDHGERLDCLDQNWARLLTSLGFWPVPLSNLVDDVQGYIEALRLDGIVLTGGNDLCCVTGGKNTAAERDRFEHQLLHACAARGYPVLGVCRGMQLLVIHYGGQLTNLDGHKATRHQVTLVSGVCDLWPASAEVNSYHQFGVNNTDLGGSLRALARAADGTIEAVVHSTLPQYGVMWHPEREQPFQPTDTGFIRWVFGNSREEGYAHGY